MSFTDDYWSDCYVPDEDREVQFNRKRRKKRDKPQPVTAMYSKTELVEWREATFGEACEYVEVIA